MKDTNNIIFLFFIASLCFYALANANGKSEEEYLNELNIEELLKIKIYSVSKYEESVSDAPALISLVTRKQIENAGWESLNDILYYNPGFYPSQDYDRKTVSSRGSFEGWNNNHLLLLIDGIPFNDNLYASAYTWEITPLLIAENVEIIRGPGSALYGTSATNGVVAINTPEVNELGYKGVFSSEIGNNGKRIIQAISGFENDDIGAIIGYSLYESDGNEYKSYDDFWYRNIVSNEKYEIKDNRRSKYLFSKVYGKNRYRGFSFQYHLQEWSFKTGHGWLWVIPDIPEVMREFRNIYVLCYRTPDRKKFEQEYAVKYQRHTISWDMRYYPDGYLDGYYPSGMSEFLETDADEIFSRAQFTYNSIKDAVLLAGVENTVFIYDGDKYHYSNINLDDEIHYQPNPDGKLSKAGPWLELINNNPMFNIGLFAQLKSGKLLGEKIESTIGLRYDNQWFTYNDTTMEYPEKHKYFGQLSPRFGLVYKVSEDFKLKSMIGRAFRAPSATELFGSNTWTLASNIKELEPEIITTAEIASDWRINNNLNWRLNLYYTDFDNQIAYSIANKNLSSNIYDLETAGIESEWFISVSDFSAFLNYSYAQRINESIIDTLISESSDKLTWAPSHSLSAGLTYQYQRFVGTILSMYQGEVQRRESDFNYSYYNILRPTQIDPWLRFDIHMQYTINNNFLLSLKVRNLFNSKDYLIKNMAYPFDYRMDNRIYSLGLKVSI